MRKVAVDLALWCFGILPAGLRVALGRLTGFLLHRICRFRTRAIADHIDLAFPELAENEKRALVKGIYRHLGLLATELLRQPTMTREDILATVSVEGEEFYRQAHAKGKGVFVLAGHIANWELGLARVAQLGRGQHVIVKEIKGEAGHYIAERMRKAHGIQMIPRRHSLKQIREVLREGGAIGFVLDQNMTDDEGVFVDFFGHPACTMSGLALLSRRYGVPVVPILFRRDADERRHHVRFLPEIEWEADPSGDPALDIRHNTQRYTRVLEDIIRRQPAQWLWIHRRWRTQPPEAGTIPAPGI